MIFFVVGCISQKNILQYKGFYQSSKIDDYYYYLRFYKNGSVIVSSSTGKPRHLKKWFNIEKEGISRGNYYFKNDSLFFEAESDFGKVLYKGVFRNGKLVLKHHSKINDNKSLNVYSFKKIKFK
ncbi:hypothetical protein [uncultured Polaribacter sp.]|uniref:hypothetical protein n=1 Tax=uncultured Polaribacter sp. TaxID=174711 RepID=UPI00259B4F5E|nr:hypothetical protein [uncultured Polaribacter sp.]